MNSEASKKIFLTYIVEVKYLMNSFVDEIYSMALNGIDNEIFNESIYIFIGGAGFLLLLGFSLFSGLRRIHNDYHLLKKGFILIPF